MKMSNKRRYKRSHIKDFIIEHIRKNFLEYIIMIIIWIIGIILGTIYINKASDTQIMAISEYITNFLDDIYNGSEIDFSNLLKSSIFNNLLVVIFLSISGLTVIGMPIVYLIVCVKGFCIGYTISAIVGTLGTWNGIKFVFSTMLLQNIIIIPCILILAVSGIKLYKSIMMDKRRENIKLEILKYTVISFLIAIVVAIASFVETYISTGIFEMIF